MSKSDDPLDPGQIDPRVAGSIKLACQAKFGVLESDFLCGSVSLLDPPAPICVAPTTTISAVIEIFRAERIGCVLVTAPDNKLLGIFSERDLVMKVSLQEQAVFAEPVEKFMTTNPVAESPTIPVAYALSLMSQGGFRHIPLLDENGHPVGIVSVKNIVDWLASRTFTDLMNFDSLTI